MRKSSVVFTWIARGLIPYSIKMNSPFNITQIGGDTFVIYPDGTAYTTGGDAANCTVSVCPVELSVYGYRPTLAGSSALIALYGLCAIAQIVLGFRYKTWGFMTAMLLGCIDEALGYAGRIMYYQNPWGETGFIMQIGTLYLRSAKMQLLTISQYSSPRQAFPLFSQYPLKICTPAS